MAATIGTVVLLGYLLQLDPLISVMPGWPRMSPTVAVLSVGAGLSLLLSATPEAPRWWCWAGRTLAAGVVLIAALLLIGHGLDRDLPFDHLLGSVPDPTPSVHPPLRSPVAFLLVGLSLLLFDADARRGYRPAQLLAPAAALFVAVTALVALLGLHSAYLEARSYVMPVLTQLNVLLLATGVLTARPGGMAGQVFASPYLGGRTVRRLTPAVVVVVVLVGSVVSLIGRSGVTVDGLPVTYALSILLMTLYLVLLRTGYMLNDVDRRQQDLIAELRDQRDFSDTVLTALVEGVVAVAPDGTVLRVNTRWCEITGYAPEQVLGLRPPYPWWPPGTVTERYDQMFTAIASAGRAELDTEIRRPDGSRLAVATTVSPMQTGAGAPRMIVATYRDLTGRDLEQAERRRMAEQLDHFFTMSRDLLCVAGTDGRLHRVNPSWQRVLGYDEADLTGRPFPSLVHPDDLIPGDPIPDGVPPGTVRIRARDGHYRWLSWNVTPADLDGTIYAVGRDVTKAKKAELALAAARDEALAAAQLKTQFVAMVSHEFRTPMNGVIGLTRLLLDTALQPAQRRYADAIRTSARALLTILNDILDFAKVEAGKITLVEGDVDLGRLIEEVAQAAAASARDKNVDVVTYYPARLPSAVRGDEGRIRQVLLNLAGNAVKFTQHGEVQIRLDVAADGRYVFAVADTGIGIDPTRIGRLFEPFVQGDGTTSREFGGTGLGLAISRQLVELMGGRLQAESTPGRGSRFHFALDLPATDPTHRPRLLREELAARRLLIADPNPTSRAFLAEHIQAWGTAVTATATAADALAELTAAARSNAPFDLVVVDDHPPELDGVDLARKISALGPTACVVLSRNAAAGPDAAAPDAALPDAAEILTKPVGPSALYNYLLEQLRRPPVGAPPPPARPAPPDRGLVLLAEDNEINRLVAVDTLEALGYRTDIARNGAEAVDLAAGREYQAILMDCQMPKLDGYAATEQVRRQEGPGRHVPIIAMTAGVLQEDRQRALQAGMDDFLAKPIDADDLRTSLERWIEAADPQIRSRVQ